MDEQPVCAEDAIYRWGPEGWWLQGRLLGPDGAPALAAGPPRETAKGLVIPVGLAGGGTALLTWRPREAAHHAVLAGTRGGDSPLHLRWWGELLLGVVETDEPGNALAAWHPSGARAWTLPGDRLPGLAWLDDVHVLAEGGLLACGTTADGDLALLHGSAAVPEQAPADWRELGALRDAVTAALPAPHQGFARVACRSLDRVYAAVGIEHPDPESSTTHVVCLEATPDGAWRARSLGQTEGTLDALHTRPGAAPLASFWSDDEAWLQALEGDLTRPDLRITHESGVVMVHVGEVPSARA
jgi:hypothetical protein